MIQYYRDLENQVKRIEGFPLSYGQIQKIYSTSRYISMAIRTPGKTYYLSFGRGGGFEGIWLGETPPSSPLRKKDRFLEYLRKHLSSCSFINVELDNFDRVAKLNYQKFGKIHSLLLFWKGRKLYFLHYFQESFDGSQRLLLSWGGRSFLATRLEDDENLYELFNVVGRTQDIKHDLQSSTIARIEDLFNEELKSLAIREERGIPKFLERKKEKIEKDIIKASQWRDFELFLTKQPQSLEKLNELNLGGHKIKFHGDLNSYEKRNLIYEKIKKLKKGEIILKNRLNEVFQTMKVKENLAIKSIELPIIGPVWQEQLIEAERPKLTINNEYKVFKIDQFQYGVGLNAKGNDALRKNWASKEDIWIHLDGIKSAHLIIKSVEQNSPGNFEFNIGASILAHFSHFNADWIPIIYTQVKNLKSVSGVSGMVSYKKEKHLQCTKIEVEKYIKD